MGAGAGHARGGVAAIAVGTVLLVAGQGTARAEGCLYQDEVMSASNQPRVERSLLCLANSVRRAAGLAPLPADSRLNAAARAHSTDMVARGYFSHTSPDGSTSSSRAQAAGYPSGAGENIAASSQGTAISIFRAWRGSPGHNSNILGPYRTGGIGAAPGFPGGGRGITGTQMFGHAPADGADTALDLYYPNERCRAAKLRRIAVKSRVKRSRRGPARAKQRRKLRRAKRAVARTCAQPAEPPLL
jgi:uncharacterized protein YkwD